MVEGCTISKEEEQLLNSESVQWELILPQKKLEANSKHDFKKEIVNKNSFTHVRLSIFPDGGVSRMRIWGRLKR